MASFSSELDMDVSDQKRNDWQETKRLGNFK